MTAVCGVPSDWNVDITTVNRPLEPLVTGLVGC